MFLMNAATTGCYRVVRVHLTQPWAILRHGGNTWWSERFGDPGHSEMDRFAPAFGMVSRPTPAFLENARLTEKSKSHACDVVNRHAPDGLEESWRMRGTVSLNGLPPQEGGIELFRSPPHCCGATRKSSPGGGDWVRPASSPVCAPAPAARGGASHFRRALNPSNTTAAGTNESTASSSDADDGDSSTEDGRDESTGSSYSSADGNATLSASADDDTDFDVDSSMTLDDEHTYYS